MKRNLVVSILLTIIIVNFVYPISVKSQRGCCSHHGGVAGCNSNGRQICNDGTLSPSCTCTPTVSYVSGCTDSSAKNYNISATKDDGSCVYYSFGCTDINSINYDQNAEKDDGSCIPIVSGCTDSSAKNYNANANTDDGSCIQFIYGCMDKKASNYNETANTSDNSCIYQTENPDDNENQRDIGSIIGGAGIITGIGYCILRKIKR